MSVPLVIIIDDNKHDRVLYQEFLGRDHFRYKELEDGQKILDVLQEEIPDLILLDWEMPHTDGLDTLKILSRSKEYKKIPVIIITGHDKGETLDLAFNYGCKDYIQKPVDKMELNARVQNILQLQDSQRELIRQREELKELYKIIKEQKIDLEKSLNIKQDYLASQEKKLRDDKEELERNVSALSLQLQKLMSHVSKAKAELKETLKAFNQKNGMTPNEESQKKKIYGQLRQIMRNLEKIDAERIDHLNYKKLLEAQNDELTEKLLSINPKLTNLELRHCNFLKMNLSNHEIADIMNVELKSLQMSRYRIKKKLMVDTNLSLRELVHSL